VAVNALVVMPSRTIRAAARLGCWIGSPKIASSDFEVLRIEREGPLGTLRDAVRWSKANAQRWIEMGEEDGARAARELAGLTTRGGIPLK
jgi:hypothetical protein